MNYRIAIIEDMVQDASIVEKLVICWSQNKNVMLKNQFGKYYKLWNAQAQYYVR